MSRVLIVNADDFGRSPGVNRGVIEAHEHGIVTAASLMIRWPAAAAAAAYVRNGGRLDLGLHVDLGEWTSRNGQWVAVYEVVPVDDEVAVRAEVERQLEAFRQLTGRDPSHLDSHQHVHREEPVRTALVAIARRLGVPLRAEHERIRHCGDFHGQDRTGRPVPGGVTVPGLLAILHTLPDGVTELGCHPGRGADHGSPYGAEREREVETLCHPAVRAALVAEALELASFAGLTRVGR